MWTRPPLPGESAGASLVTLSTGRGGSATEPNTAVTEPATDTVIDTPVENTVEPVIETVTNAVIARDSDALAWR